MVILLLPKGYCLGSIHLLSMACPQLLALCRMMHGVLPFVWHPCLPLSWIILSSRGCPWDFLNQQSLWCLRGLRGIVCRALQDPLCTQPSALCPLWALHMNLVLFPDKAKFSSVCCWQPDTFPFLSFRVMDLKKWHYALYRRSWAHLSYSSGITQQWKELLCLQSSKELGAGLKA